MDLGVRDPGVVIDHGVHVRMTHQHVAPAAPRLAGSRSPVLPALDSSDRAPAAPVGNVAEFLHINMDQRAGMVVLVSAGWFSGSAVDVGEPVQSFPHQDGVNRGGRELQETADLDRAEPACEAQMNDLPDEGSRGLVRVAVWT
jgi:hypothetical protein